MKKIELLCPAGSLGNLKAAIAGGADAIYLGMNKFNAREFATNFNEKYLPEAVKICKSNNVRIYLTMNTLVKNSEIKEFLEQLKYAYEQGIDAVIIQDLSLIEIIKKSFPGLEIHISTQAGIMNSLHANLLEDVESINVARELDKDNLRLLRKNYNRELEMFVHGALCACVSGSCLFSSFLGGRSGNRGKCAQPCRKLYNNEFLLSTKELCLLENIPEIINLGINSLKIEGRMRTPYYTFTTAKIYRKAIDSFYQGKFKITPEMKKELYSAFSREFTQGKFLKKDIFNVIRASGFSSPILQEYNVNINDINLPKRKSNLIVPKRENKESSGKKMIVRIYNNAQAAIAEKYADIVCMDIFNEDFLKIKNKLTKPLYGVTPRIMFDSDLEKIEQRIKSLSPEGILAGNLGILKMKLDLPIVLDYNSNSFNDLQIGYYQNKKAIPIISPELSIAELEQFKNKDFIIFAHGNLRLMTLAHNLKEREVIDRKGFNFKIKKIYNGAEVLNEKELGLFNKIRPLVKQGINKIYIDTENSREFEQILKLYAEILNGKTPDCSEIQKNYVLGWSKKGVL